MGAPRSRPCLGLTAAPAGPHRPLTSFHGHGQRAWEALGSRGEPGAWRVASRPGVPQLLGSAATAPPHHALARGQFWGLLVQVWEQMWGQSPVSAACCCPRA